MFDIINYDINLLIIFSLGLFVILYLIFKKYLNSLIDPLVYHIFWLSLGGSLIFSYPGTHSNIGIVYIIIVLQYLLYIFSLAFFYNIFNKKLKPLENSKENKYYNSQYLLIFLFTLYLFSKKSFLLFAMNAQDIMHIFIWRIIDFQGRDPLERILALGVYPYLLFIIYYNMKFKDKNFLSKFFFIVILTVEILSGGRASILGILFGFGTFMFIYNQSFSKKEKRKILFSFGITFIILFIYISFLKTTQYMSGSNIDPGYAVLNRFFATYDGIDYYLTYNGIENIKFGFSEYLMSIFGVYVKNILDVSYKNIGWQLSELASGSTLTFAQGSNFTFLLQGLVFSPYIAMIYSILIAWIAALLRYSFYINSPIFSFALVSLSYRIVSDIEYAVLSFISILIVFSFIKINFYIQRIKI